MLTWAAQVLTAGTGSRDTEVTITFISPANPVREFTDDD